MGDDETLVSVILPAKDAGQTLQATLASVLAQTHRRLEVVVVDDGSTDETGAIVRERAASDPRLRLIVQPNRGVAAARNAALEASSGDYVAPIDADDLWRPDKIEKQLATIRRRGPRAGLAYSWSALVDLEGRVTAVNGSDHEGEVLEALCLHNFVGNGSAALMRRDAVLDAGGYDPGLRAAGAQGCEDLKLYLALAERWDFAVVREPLTGYRRTPAAMSGDVRRMLRSFDLVAGELEARRPDLKPHLRRGRARLMGYLVGHALGARRLGPAAELYLHLISQNPAAAGRVAAKALSWRLDRPRRRAQAAVNFLDAPGDPVLRQIGSAER